MDTFNVAIPDSLKAYIDDRVTDGGYRSASEYMQSLIQADQARRALEMEIVKGLESGNSVLMDQNDWNSIRDEVVRRHEERNIG